MVLKQTAAKVRKEHYPAPFALIDVWKRGGSSIQQRLKLEARSVAKLAETSTAQNLIRIFFLQERLKDQGSGIEHGIKHVHVVGAGVMGGDIAAWAAFKGFDVTLQDREMKYIQPALDRARQLYEKKLKTADKIEATTRRLRADVDGKGVATADLAIEAIYENAEAKRALYAIIEPQFQADEMLATQHLEHSAGRTARGPESAAALPRPALLQSGGADAAGRSGAPRSARRRPPRNAHSPSARRSANCRWPSRARPGFLVNRILMPYLLEAMRLYNEGVPGPVLDKEAKKFGMPMGPIELADTVGLDVCASVGKELAPFLGLELPPGLEEKLEAGKRGKKDGQGLYVWQDGKPQKPEVDPDYVLPPDLQERMILPMVNEAVACLAEGVVDDADLLDAGVIFGTGFAPFRGGPIQYVRSEGADVVQGKLERLAKRYGERFTPKSGWDLPTLVQTGFDLSTATTPAETTDA